MPNQQKKERAYFEALARHYEVEPRTSVELSPRQFSEERFEQYLVRQFTQSADSAALTNDKRLSYIQRVTGAVILIAFLCGITFIFLSIMNSSKIHRVRIENIGEIGKLDMAEETPNPQDNQPAPQIQQPANTRPPTMPPSAQEPPLRVLKEGTVPKK